MKRNTRLHVDCFCKIPTLARLVMALILCCALNSHSSAQNWPQFRGPNGNGVVEKLAHPLEWGKDNNVAWSVDVPGGGLSSPIIFGDKVIVTTAVGMGKPVSFMEGVRDMRPKSAEADLKFQVFCFSLNDGSTLWEKTIASKKPDHPIHASNSFATESPATNGESVFVYFAAIGVVCALDFDGEEIWRTEIGSYPTGNGFGTGSSLVCNDEMVFVQCDNDEKSFAIALDAASGDEAWRQDRSGSTSWATPLLWKNDKRTELVTCGSGFVTSYDPGTGDELWTLTNMGMSFSSSPAMDQDNIYFGNSGPRSVGPLVAINSQMNGKVAFDSNASQPGKAWAKLQAGPGMSSPVSVGGYVYIPSRGRLACYSASDGSEVFKERMEIGSAAASMWGGGDYVFLMDEDGKTVVMQTGPELKIVATNQLEGDLFWSTPSVAGESLLIRGANKLYCIRDSQ